MQHRRWSWWAWALACLVGLAALAAIILAVWKLPSLLYGDVNRASPDARLQGATGFRTVLVAGLAGLAALGSLAMATRTYRLTQQSQFTDRYTKAIEQLGSDKLDIRLGGIYALERIAIDSERDHPTVVEVLSAFVREHSHPDHTEESNRETKLATDVKAALTVLGRLPFLPNVDRGDLSNAYLVSADLRGANLSGFRLIGANLRGATLGGADPNIEGHGSPRLPAANLQRADLRGADLREAWLQEVNLEKANLFRAPLQRANLERANLREANLGDADLGGANLEGADLSMVNLQSGGLEAANLRGANLSKANLQATGLDGADLTNVVGLTWAQLDKALLDARTLLPAGLPEPDSTDARRSHGE